MALPPNFPPTPRDQLPPDVQTELAPIEARLQTIPNDPASLLAAANVFEKRKLYANELAQYYLLRQQWPDAPWVKAKIFELESSLAEQYAAANRKTTNGKTYALLVGISTYAKPELNLQFAHADAIDFSKLLATPRSGPVGSDDMLLLTNEKATTAAIRNAFQDFLKQKAGKADTVIILMAGHGTVEAKGDKGAYIVTYDSDPENLKDTALALPELQKLFDEQLQNVGRVVIFVDVCNAGAVGIIKGKNPINQQIEQQLGSADGSLTGLLAAGPTESSFESPSYGGGHGAFSYFVIKGMSGDADAEGNRDGVDRRTRVVRLRIPARRAIHRRQAAPARVRVVRESPSALGCDQAGNTGTSCGPLCAITTTVAAYIWRQAVKPRSPVMPRVTSRALMLPSRTESFSPVFPEMPQMRLNACEQSCRPKVSLITRTR